MKKLLLIEDDPEFSGLIAQFLETKGIISKIVEDPYYALLEKLENFDIVLLDLGLPGMDGLELCKAFRKKSTIAIIISSARGSVSDKVLGLQLGADDYLPKPYDPDELYARIISLLRRIQPERKEEKSKFRIDANLFEIFFQDSPLHLTQGEFEVLHSLLDAKGAILSKDQILGTSPSIKSSDGKSLEMLISKIRQKLKPLSQEQHILSSRGRGYRVVE